MSEVDLESKFKAFGEQDQCFRQEYFFGQGIAEKSLEVLDATIGRLDRKLNRKMRGVLS